MQSRTKNILLILLIAIGLAGSFVGGSFFGMNFAYKLYKPFFTGDKYLQTRLAQLALQKIDTNEIKKGHNLLVLQVNNGILSLDKSIEQEEDEEMRKKRERRKGEKGSEFFNFLTLQKQSARSAEHL